MRGFIITLFMLLSLGAFSQTLSWENPKVTVENREYELIEATDFVNVIAYTEYKNGRVYETGFYRNGTLHGIWKGYNENGIVMIEMEYDNGKRLWLKTKTDNKDITVLYKDGRPMAVTYYLASN